MTRIPALLAKLLRRSIGAIAFNEHYSGDGAIIYRHACAPGCEGIVSKLLGVLVSERARRCWIKVKNSAAPEVTREVEEDCAGVSRIDTPEGRRGAQEGGTEGE